MSNLAETMEGSLEKNDFMDVFYTNFMDKLIAPVSGEVPAGAAAAKGAKQAAASSKISSSGQAALDSSATKNAAGSSSSSSSSSVPASTIGLIVDLLCFCVQHHQYFAKYHVLRWVAESCCSWGCLGPWPLLPCCSRWRGNEQWHVSASCTHVSAGCPRPCATWPLLPSWMSAVHTALEEGRRCYGGL